VSYEDFFRRVCGFDPYPFQLRLHETNGDLRVLEVPTGLGKTMTVVADWLFDRPTTRLVYCLPGRALTRQVADVVRKMVNRNGGASIQVFELMGGGNDLDAKIRPHQQAILIGTQDILLSRALNRGYAFSPFRWPMDFGLLNNDVTWVFDEVQLLGEAVATGAQLAAFRKMFATFGGAHSIWMTATFERSWLKTVDCHDEPALVKLDAADLANKAIEQRVNAEKSLNETTACDTPHDCAAFVSAEHQENQLSLVIANTVARAQEIWEELRKLKLPAILLHSRFRPCDREGIVDQVLSKNFKGVIVATQVIEAGVDIDADLMITDAAPWSSLVQRFGRVNRSGNKPHARIYWVRNPRRHTKVKLDGTQYKPYRADEVQRAIAALEQLSSASPNGLAQKVSASLPYRYVLRKTDLCDLFDTTPDLAGNQIDISRFVRSGDETNVYVAWRSWSKEQHQPDNRAFTHGELCPVPFFPGKSEFKDWLKKQEAWTWNYAKRGRWERIDPDRVYAGMRLLVRSEAGGYVPERGWAPESKTAVPEYENIPTDSEVSMDSDSGSDREEQSLAEHSDAVVAELQRLLGSLRVDLNAAGSTLERAARLHDWGKAHPVFQQTLHKLPDLLETAPDPLLAKQTRERSAGRHSRPGFRHELASALAALSRGERFLTAYVVAAHHGKVRANIRSIDGEKPEHQNQRVARGIQEGDKLFPADLGGGVQMPEACLDLKPMDLGATDGVKGWSDRVVDLLDELGPFRLAYLELLLRTADEVASGEKAK
jgi:CRISPR-associated endonuclease/helicase Cas3